MRLLCKELKVWSHEELLAIFASFMYTRYVFVIMSPRNNKLSPSLNFFGVGLYCCDVFQSRRNSLKCQNQGKNKVKLKGDPTFRLLTPVAKEIT